jgi:hypothetical protein
MQLKPGTRLRSTAGTVEVIVVRAGTADVELACEGAAMLPSAEVAAGGDVPAVSSDAKIELGKRYADEELGIEVLCTSAGPGQLTVDGRPLGLKQAQALPSSD